MGNGADLPPAEQAGDGPVEGATTPEPTPDLEIAESVFMKENVRLGPFQSQILECQTKRLLRESIHA